MLAGYQEFAYGFELIMQKLRIAKLFLKNINYIGQILFFQLVVYPGEMLQLLLL